MLVPASLDRAFALFTAQVGRWWPLATHSVGGETPRSVAMEGRPGGRLVETLADGSTAAWGSITECDPPRQVAFTWHPGSPPEQATHVAVTFTPEGPDALVTLVHSGWGSRPDGSSARTAYETGWNPVLAGLVTAARA